MLRKRSRSVSSKQGMMPDFPSFPSPTSNHCRSPASSLFPSQRLSVGFSPKGLSDTQVAMSPTSTLETKPFSATGNPFFSDKNPRKPLLEPTQETKRHQPIGLGIVGAMKKSSKPESRMVLFGSQLKIQIPSISQTGLSVESPHSPIEFGVKNKNSQLALLSPARRSSMCSANLVSGCLSVSEMETSEDYTCVIAHGPNPKTIHIFDNCIVESWGDGFALATPRKDNRVLVDHLSGYLSDDFLTFCHACKKKLGQGKDIFMYRGEKAFCSRECRYQEMLFDVGMEDISPNPSATL